MVKTFSSIYNDFFFIFLPALVIIILVGILEYFSFVLCKCPYCGRFLRVMILGQTHCPYCGADLDDGFSWESEVIFEIEREDAEKEKVGKENNQLNSSAYGNKETSFDNIDVNSADSAVNDLNNSVYASEDKSPVVRRATAKDIPFLLALLSQVLEVHASIKPDYFVSGYTKYNSTELEDILDDESKRVYVADINGAAVGYAFCDIKEMPSKPFVQHFKYMYIDDICIDSNYRGKDVATKIFEHVKEEARALGCRDITLNVWTGNQRAFAFYQKMGMKPQKTTMEMKV